MCHPSRNLHGIGKSSNKATKKIKKSVRKVTKKNVQDKHGETPCEAQLFFLENEDVLY